MKKMVSIWILALCVVAISSTAFAWSPRVEGRPDIYDPGEMMGYFVWHDHHGFHVRTTTRGSEHHFSGEISTNGRIVGADGVRLEENDHYRVSPHQHKLKFDLDTQGGQDGLNFHIAGGDKVTFELYVDGHRVNPNRIFIGDRGLHPREGEFTLYR